MDSGRSTSPATEITGWITKGSKSVIAGVDGTIQSFRYVGSSLCNDGDTFECRTCTGVTFFLLVPAGSRSPTVGETYRFRPTGADSFCGNFRVRLLEADSCDGSATTTAERPTENTAETATETTTETATTTETTSTQTATEPATEPTTETTTETATTTETTIETTAETTSDEADDDSDEADDSDTTADE